MKGAIVVAGWAVACGGAAPQAELQARAPTSAPAIVAAATAKSRPVTPAPAEREASRPSDDESLTRELPTSCSSSDGCVPDAAFAESVCRGKFPNLPFAMFAKSAPWQHLFVKAVTVEPVNVHGGTRSDVPMNFGEEVVVLRRRGPGNAKGVQISGPTDLDVLRWDGTCATIREEMFVKYNPGQFTSPRIVWKYVDDPIREVLLKSSVIQRAQANERKSCRDSSAKNPSPACEKAMLRLTEAVMVAVRASTELPAPSTTPAWRKPAGPTASR